MLVQNSPRGGGEMLHRHLKIAEYDAHQQDQLNSRICRPHSGLKATIVKWRGELQAFRTSTKPASCSAAGTSSPAYSCKAVAPVSKIIK